ncbi:MAG: hypothetical protein K2X47_15670, partial [Bdellovibrionales bacterium]|nr:hypothetical protein [Bdellovibrionales bacterium]
MLFPRILFLFSFAVLAASCTNTVPEISESFQFNGIVFGGKTTTAYKVASSPACSSALTVVGECDARVSGMKFSLDDGKNWTAISSLTNGSDGSCGDGKFSLVFSDICTSLGVATAQTVTKKILLSGTTLTGTQSQGSVSVVFEPAVAVPVLPQVSISNAPTALEGTSAIFNIVLSQASTQAVSVTYGTSNTTASATDYTATSGTLTFAPGETAKTISVPVLADSLYENASETFVLTLTNPINADLGSASAIGTITDGDTAPVIQFASAAQNFLENAGSATVTIVPSVASASALTISYTVSGTATGGGVDYTLAAGNIVIPANAVSASLTVPVVNDAIIEGAAETVVVTLGTVSIGTLGAASVHTLSIIDDDLPNLSINDVSINEGGTLTFTITLSASSPSPVSVNWQTTNGTALSGVDYTAASNVAIITAGSTSTIVTVNTIDNGIVCQSARTLNLNLSGAVGAVIMDAQGVGSIIDPDRPTLSVADASGVEGSIINVVASLSAVCPLYNVGFTWTTLQGTAMTGDFTAVNSSATITAGQTTQILPVSTVGDSLNEGNEVFTVNLGALTEATFADSSASVTILDDDGLPMLAIDSPS